MATFLGVPLRLHGGPIGMIGLANRAVAYHEDHERLALTFASLVAVLIHKAQLYEQLQQANASLELLVGDRTRALAQARDALAEKAARLQAVLADTVDAAERERRRIAGDIHDGINQLLIGAMLELTSGQHRLLAGQSTAAGQALESAREILAEVEGEIRRVVHDLHPPILDGLGLPAAILDGLGLPAAIRDVAERFSTFSQVPVRVDVSGRPMRLPARTEISLYRVVQEALQNVAVHARAHSVELQLTFESDQRHVAVRLTDDGCGFSPGEVEGARIDDDAGIWGWRACVVGWKAWRGVATGLAAVLRHGHPRQGAGSGIRGRRLAVAGPRGSRMIRVLVVDDHPIVRQGLRSLLSNYAAFDVVGEASSVEEGLDLFRQTRPDVSLVDIRLGAGSGLDLLDWLLEEDPAARVIVVSSFDDDEFVTRSLRAGALGYLIKVDSPSVLVSAIETVAAGQRALSPRVAAHLVDQLMREAPDVGPDLDALEVQMLSMLSRGLSNGQIADHLFMSDTTVKRVGCARCSASSVSADGPRRSGWPPVAACSDLQSLCAAPSSA